MNPVRRPTDQFDFDRATGSQETFQSLTGVTFRESGLLADLPDRERFLGMSARGTQLLLQHRSAHLVGGSFSITSPPSQHRVNVSGTYRASAPCWLAFLQH